MSNPTIYYQLSKDKDDPFYIVNVGNILKKHKTWLSLLPRVEPFYAVKCNDDRNVLATLSALGIGFDCASMAEIKAVLKLGVPPSKIVYANPCKQASHLKFAAKREVSMMTFDNEPELHKVKQLHPTAKLILRLLTDDSKSLCRLGQKYGAPLKTVPNLLQVARNLDLNVVGISFHVGSGCYDASAFSSAVEIAKTAFDYGKSMGFQFDILDIGGGFPGSPRATVSFEEISATLNKALNKHFPVESGVRIIAEPGRYYVASAFNLAVNVIAKRQVNDDNTQAQGKQHAYRNQKYMYYVNDGVYGSFNCLLYDHAIVYPKTLGRDNEQQYSSSIWGPTCDGLDCVMKECMLPELDVGDWMYFEDMGAYTAAAASNFNGFQKPLAYYVIEEKVW
ncbi:uncharacterized protein TRIADDRAFT_27475 [Trichoplax adhaerens]|uniref:ornithine decarboxylase n=1 Tax=Trichoplax adhaerens TaxID=10228 RepID=B3S1G3_TRIAD|nr:hypothetical protein TRIADDRAFT_27475 [Trichoplax adhaerens]EDV23538.1 hypothetical protein TRIADDRAFT_27475 [Trichoplax adhaerens]|eukprot:XP_002114448.1 hypothetical protein TRIADDRAFT_27475 [Trichoplax adhaerens]